MERYFFTDSLSRPTNGGQRSNILRKHDKSKNPTQNEGARTNIATGPPEQTLETGRANEQKNQRIIEKAAIYERHAKRET